MSPAATDQVALLLGRRSPRRRKRDLILELCRGRDVLDVGCVEHSWRMSVENPGWLHAAIRDAAASCLGVDYLADDVAELNARGYSMVAGNVLRDRPPGSYDVVVAGDIIEHLESPGVFLDYLATALRPDGVAVVSTPSAFSLAEFGTILLKRRPSISPEHAVLFDPFTFGRLVDRSPLRVRELHWLEPSWYVFADSPNWWVRNVVGRLLHQLTRPLLALRPYLNTDFAAVLELRPEGEGATDPAASALAVMDYLGYQRPPSEGRLVELVRRVRRSAWRNPR